MTIINPCGYIEKGKTIISLFQQVAETGDRDQLSELEETLNKTIKMRDSLTPQERAIISEIYQDTHYRIIRDGDYLDHIYGIVMETLEEIDIEEDENQEDYIKRKLMIGSLKMAMKSKIKAKEEKEEDMKRDINKFFKKMLEI